jgi:hypothetical protein
MKLRIKTKSRPISDFVGLPGIPGPIDDNLYLTAAVRAAAVDKESNAYDEFLFTENGVTQMPYEDSVDAHLGLVSHRMIDEGRREQYLQQQKILKAESELKLAEAAVLRSEVNLSEANDQLIYQTSILNGERSGKDNLIWKDSLPQFTSIMDSRIKLLIPVAIFLLVGFVDIRIIFVSLLGIDGFSEQEAIVFALPAIGIQLVFPHLIGDRIRLNRHGSTSRGKNIWEIAILGILWAIFCMTLTFIRLEHINEQAGNNGGKLDIILYNVLIILNFLMLIGLGSMLILLTARTNPHYREFHRVKVAKSLLEKKLDKQLRSAEIIRSEIPILKHGLEVTRESYEEITGEINSALNETAKSVYRRALVNRFSEVDFTNSYLNANESISTNKSGSK